MKCGTLSYSNSSDHIRNRNSPSHMVGKSRRRSSILKVRQPDTVTHDVSFEFSETTKLHGNVQKNKRRVSFHSHKEVKHFDKAVVEMNEIPVKEPMGYDVTNSTDASKMSISALSASEKAELSSCIDDTLLLFKNAPPRSAVPSLYPNTEEAVDMSISIIDVSVAQGPDTTAALFSGLSRKTTPMDEITCAGELEDSRRFLDATNDDLTMNLFANTRKTKMPEVIQLLDETNHENVSMDISQKSNQTEVGNDQTNLAEDMTMALFGPSTRIRGSRVRENPAEDMTLTLFGPSTRIKSEIVPELQNESLILSPKVDKTTSLFDETLPHRHGHQSISMDISNKEVEVDRFVTVHEYEVVKDNDKVISLRDIVTEVRTIEKDHYQNVTVENDVRLESNEEQEMVEPSRRQLSKNRDIGSPMVVAKKKSKRISGDGGDEKVIEVDTTIREFLNLSMDEGISQELMKNRRDEKMGEMEDSRNDSTFCQKKSISQIDDNGGETTFSNEVQSILVSCREASNSSSIENAREAQPMELFSTSFHRSINFDNLQIPEKLGNSHITIPDERPETPETLIIHKTKEFTECESSSVEKTNDKPILENEKPILRQQSLSVVGNEENPSLASAVNEGTSSGLGFPSAAHLTSTSRSGHDISKRSDLSMDTSLLSMRHSFVGVSGTGVRYLDHNYNDDQIKSIVKMVSADLVKSIDEKLKANEGLRNECFAVLEKKDSRLLNVTKTLNARKFGDEVQDLVRECRNLTQSEWYKMRMKVAEDGLRRAENLEADIDVLYEKRLYELKKLSEEKNLREELTALEEQAHQFEGIDPEIMEEVIESQSEDAIITKFMAEMKSYHERRMKQHEWIVKVFAEMEAEAVEDERRKEEQRLNRRRLLELIRTHDRDVQGKMDELEQSMDSTQENQ